MQRPNSPFSPRPRDPVLIPAPMIDEPPVSKRKPVGREPKGKKSRLSNEEYRKKVSKSGVYFCATWWDIEHPPTVEFMSKLDLKVKAFIYQKEKCPQSGNLHYQCYFELMIKTSLSRVLSIFKKINMENDDDANKFVGVRWSLRYDTHERAYNYCRKEDTRVEPPVTFGNFTQGIPGDESSINTVLIGNDDDSEKKKPSLLTEAVRLIQAGKTSSQIAMENLACFIMYGKKISEAIAERAPPRENVAPTVIVYYGPPACGKTRKCRELYPDAYWFSCPKEGNNAWFHKYAGEKVVIIDEFYGQMEWDQLLRLLDRYEYKVEIKGSWAQMQATTFVFTSNSPPCEWYSNKKKGNGQHISELDFQTLRRRIAKCYKFILVQDVQAELLSDSQMPIIEYITEEQITQQCPTGEKATIEWRIETAKQYGAFKVGKIQK